MKSLRAPSAACHSADQFRDRAQADSCRGEFTLSMWRPAADIFRSPPTATGNARHRAIGDARYRLDHIRTSILIGGARFGRTARPRQGGLPVVLGPLPLLRRLPPGGGGTNGGELRFHSRLADFCLASYRGAVERAASALCPSIVVGEYDNGTGTVPQPIARNSAGGAVLLMPEPRPDNGGKPGLDAAGSPESVLLSRAGMRPAQSRAAFLSFPRSRHRR